MIRHNRHGAHEREAGYHGEATVGGEDGNDAPENHGQSARGGEARDEQRRPQWFEGVKRVQQIVYAGEDTRRVVNVKRRSQTVVITPGGESLRDSSMKT